MRALNLTLLTDLYELTMMQGYFKNPTDQIVVFDAFYRKNPCDGGYAICAGLEQVIEYIRDLHFAPDDIDYLKSLKIFDTDFLEYLRGFHFTGDIYAIPEGTIIFPREPLLKVIAPVMEAQLIETALLNILNHQSLIATKASRVVYAAKGDGIMEFGLRRAQGPDAGIYGARAAMIGGCIGTSNVLTGQMFDVPVKGTHAHSWIMSFPDEYTAFKTYANLYPDACILLVDTYDVLKSGVPNAIRVFKEMQAEGIELKGYGIRIDSGDLAYLSKQAYKMLKEAGLDRINHNLNSSRSFYPEICTTHTYEQRVNNIKMLQGLGFEICSGGIIGMGESKEDVVDMLMDLREINPESVPINFLLPIPGTRLADRDISELTPEYCLKVLCLARLMISKSDIRCAAGREVYFKGIEPTLFKVVDSIFASGYLTAGGQGIDATMKMIEEAGFTGEIESTDEE